MKRQTFELIPRSTGNPEMLRAEVRSYVEELRKDSDYGKLLDSEITVDVDPELTDRKTVRVTFHLASDLAVQVLEKMIRPRLERNYQIIGDAKHPAENLTENPTVDAGDTAAVQAPQPARPFDSIEEFAGAHTDLLEEELTGDRSQDPDLLERIRDLVRRGAATGALLEPVSARRTAQSFLNYWLTVLYRAGDKGTNAILACYVKPADKNLATTRFPYLGLRPFTEAEQDKFFGRKSLIASIIKAVSEKALVVLVGPSGSGKTSLINAGVMPALRSRNTLPGSEEWRVLPTIVPGRQPLMSLATLLVSGVGNNGEQLQQEAGKLLQSSDYLVQRFDAGELPVALVVDQFDEVFTLSNDDQKRDAFIANVLSLLKSSKHKVILSMRSDRINFVVRRPELNDLFRDVELRMPLPQESDLHEIIEKPAHAIGLKFQTGVVEQLIRETYGDPVGLPLLQFGLWKLWEEKEGNTITWAAMNRMHSCRDALIQNASDFFNALSPEDKKTTRQILLKMVRLSDNLEVAGDATRRGDLYQDEAPEAVDRMLESFVKVHLVRVTPSVKLSPGLISDSSAQSVDTTSHSSPDDQFELAHDSLARDWPELVESLRKLREVMLTRQRLESLANNWAVLGRSDIGLLDKYQLHEAEKWLQGAEAAVLGYQIDVPALVKKSREAIERQKLFRRAAVVGSISVIVAALIIAVIVAVSSQRGWVRSTSRELAHQASEFKHAKLDVALLLSLAAYDKDPSNPDALKRLVNSLSYSPKLSAFFHTEQPQAVQIVFSPDGGRLSALSRDGTTSRWDTSNNKQLGSTFRLPHSREKSTQLAESSDSLRTDNPVLLNHSGEILVSQGDGNSLVIWDVMANKSVAEVSVAEKAAPSAGAFALTFSNDDRELAWLTPVENAQTKSLELSIWSFTEKKKVQAILSQENLVNLLAFSPDNRTLAAATADGAILLWQARDLRLPLKRIEQAFHNSAINRIIFSRDSTKLAAIDSSGAIGIWQVQDGKRLGRLTHEPKVLRAEEISNRVFSFAISRNGGQVVAGYDDGNVTFWKVDGNNFPFPGSHGKQVTQISFGAEDEKVVTVAGEEGSILLWDMNSDRKEALPTGRSGRISTVSFSPDNRTLAASSQDGTIILWDFRRILIGEQLTGASQHGSVTNQMFTRDAKLISRDASDRITVFDAISRQPIRNFSIGRGEPGQAVSLGEVVISKNGKILAVRQVNGEIAYWDIERGQVKGTLGAGTSEALEAREGSEQSSSLKGEHSIGTIAISPNGNWLASGRGGGTITLWDLDNGRATNQVSAGGPIRSLAFSEDVTKLASGDDNGVIKIWDATNLEFRTTIQDKASIVSNLSFSPDGTKLASVGEDGTVDFWDVADEGKLISQLGSSNSNVVFNAEGTVLACIKYDGSIVFWDVRTVEPIGTFVLSDDRNPVASLAYSPDGTTLAAGHEDGSIQLLNIGIDAWRKRACTIANRNLSPGEIARYKVLEDQELIRWIMRWRSEMSFYTPVCRNLPAGKDLNSFGYAGLL